MKLQRSAPEKQGVKSQAIIDFLNKIKEEKHELHSFMLLKNGNVISECWWKPYAPQYRHQLCSLTKSFTSTAIGMASDEGLLTVNTFIVDIFKKEMDELGSHIDEKIKKMTVKNLLTMGTGMEYQNWGFENLNTNKIKNFLSSHIKNEPGSTFFYHSLATYIQSAVITRITEQKLVDYLTPRLFAPLGIDPYWEEDNLVINTGNSELYVTTEDIAKFGQLYLQRGNWAGKQLISENWINEATSKQINNGNDPDSDWEQGYGYNFWICKPDGVYRGDGAYGQFCIVMPKENAVIAITSNVDMKRVLNIIWDILLPALRENNEPSEDKAAHNRLLQSQKNLSHLKVSENSPKFPKIHGKYAGENEKDKVYLDINEIEGIIEIDIDNKKFIYTFKKGEWIDNISDQIWESGLHKCFRSKIYGEWKPDENMFDLVVWFYETPPKNNIRLKFNRSKTKLILEIEYDDEGEKIIRIYEYNKI